MIVIPKKLSLRVATGLLAWLTLTFGLVVIAIREHYQEEQFLNAALNGEEGAAQFAGPTPFDRPERMSVMHLNPYLLGALGLAGALVAAASLASGFPKNSFAILGRAALWEAFPASCWMYSLWDGPSDFFTAAEITALVLAPTAAGLAHRSWKVAAASVLLAIIASGLMWAGFIMIMGNGR